MIVRDKRFALAVILTALLLMAGASLAWAQTNAPQRRTLAQDDGSPTAVPLAFPTATETPGPPTDTPTRTPTSIGRPWVEALAVNTNVRAGPDINEAKVGVIYPGDTYPILGKRFQWYYIEFPEAPGGRAWVHESVVVLGGDVAQIVELEAIPTTAPEAIEAQQTLDAITLTPGLALTLTEQALITPTGAFTVQPGEGPTLAPGQPLPTFTPPAATPTPLTIPRQNPPADIEGGLAPIIPILILGALGLMGLLVSIMRRL